MAKTPPIPPQEQQYPGQRADIEGKRKDRRDSITGLQSSSPGDDDVNLDQQGRQANTRQNLTPQRSVQDR